MPPRQHPSSNNNLENRVRNTNGSGIDRRRRILFIDAYDSFSNNVVSLLYMLLDADIDVLHIDEAGDAVTLQRQSQDGYGTPENPSASSPSSPPSPESGFTREGEWRAKLSSVLRSYDAVVCGPGPGSPDRDRDVGLMRYIWELSEKDLVPVLGICLGFQSLAVSCRAKVRKLRRGGLHGIIREIEHRQEEEEKEEVDDDEKTQQCANIFRGVPPFKATLYHSLCADIGQDAVSTRDWPDAKWNAPPHLPDMIPLAWVEEENVDYDDVHGEDGASQRILMAIKHKWKPFWGLQYHPESICSGTAGHAVISNWFREALRWNESRGRIFHDVGSQFAPGARRPSLLAQSALLGAREQGVEGSLLLDHALHYQYMSETIALPSHVEVPHIVEILQAGRRDHIVLDSASAHANRIGLDVRGRYSIIALDVDEAPRLQYRVGKRCVTLHLPLSLNAAGGASEDYPLGTKETIWHFLAEFMERRRLAAHDQIESPFLGGFMGYVTYELGLEAIDIDVSDRSHDRPDLCYVWVTKSIVIDHLENTLRIQHLAPSATEGDLWLRATSDALQNPSVWADGLRIPHGKPESGPDQLTPPRTPIITPSVCQITTPKPSEYEEKVRSCQSFITAGHSYELCLTDQTTIIRPRFQANETEIQLSRSAPTIHTSKQLPSAWTLYKTLRQCQPAPFGSYLRLGPATLISSSPERFLEYSASGLCSMRPMKGTVRKSAGVGTLAEAEEILHVPKEMAENLMIVDLVRHDLHTVCGPGRVWVPRLMAVEEYASVFQMISVVEGQLPDGCPAAARSEDPGEDETTGSGRACKRRYTGFDILSASLPPGSMTGAPKKRSCEILRGLETRPGLDGHGGRQLSQERSLYSGVVGYHDVRGRGDWSVTIRSLFRWDDEVLAEDVGGDSDGHPRHSGSGDGMGKAEHEVWRIGAGGAVTALSTAEAEREEMFVKLGGPLGVFTK